MKLITGVSSRDANVWPAAAVPVSEKIPAPMMAPMPMAVSATGPSVRFICRSGAAASAIRRSGLFVLNSSRATARDRLIKQFDWSIQSFGRDFRDTNQAGASLCAVDGEKMFCNLAVVWPMNRQKLSSVTQRLPLLSELQVGAGSVEAKIDVDR